MTIVRQFSRCGPCLTLGQVTKITPRFYFFDEWRGGDKYEGEKRVARDLSDNGGPWSPNHVIPCPSCRDHPKTQYPHGSMD